MSKNQPQREEGSGEGKHVPYSMRRRDTLSSMAPRLQAYGRSTKVTHREKTDWISGLPDAVLVHILSFLPTKYAVGTSVLSRRWQYLFTWVTNFDFDESLRFASRTSMKPSTSFKNFVDRVLILREASHIDKFRLKCGFDFDYSNVYTWIKVAVLNGVTELDIFTYEYNPFSLPLSLFKSETLAVLKLHVKFPLNIPSSLLLPCLKILHLFSSGYSCCYPLNWVIAQCPLLEELTIGGSWEDIKVIDVYSSTLRSLTMDFSGHSDPFHRSVSLDLPNLQRFSYFDFLASNYCLKNLSSLEEARIYIALDEELSVDAILSLLKGLASAKHLYLCGECVENLSYCGRALPVFSNLSRLELGGTEYVCWRGILPQILHSSPMLDHLVFSGVFIHRDDEDDAYDDNNFWVGQQSPPCLSSNIKTITISPFSGYEEELRIVKYFLRNGKVLKNLTLDCWINSEEMYQRLEKVLNMEKASPECKIEIMDEEQPDCSL